MYCCTQSVMKHSAIADISVKALKDINAHHHTHVRAQTWFLFHQSTL